MRPFMEGELSTMRGPINPASEQEIRDEHAAARLCKTYALAVDSLNEDMLRSLFDPAAPMKGTLSSGTASDYLGRLLDGLRNFSATMHSILNQYVSIEGDEGHVWSYAVAYHVHKPENGGGLMVMGIQYRDSVERIADGWVISSREVVRIFSDGPGVPSPIKHS